MQDLRHIGRVLLEPERRAVQGQARGPRDRGAHRSRQGGPPGRGAHRSRKAVACPVRAGRLGRKVPGGGSPDEGREGDSQHGGFPLARPAADPCPRFRPGPSGGVQHLPAVRRSEEGEADAREGRVRRLRCHRPAIRLGRRGGGIRARRAGDARDPSPRDAGGTGRRASGGDEPGASRCLRGSPGEPAALRRRTRANAPSRPSARKFQLLSPSRPKSPTGNPRPRQLRQRRLRCR